jgi:hypothetical protein
MKNDACVCVRACVCACVRVCVCVCAIWEMQRIIGDRRKCDDVRRPSFRLFNYLFLVREEMALTLYSPGIR